MKNESPLIVMNHLSQKIKLLGERQMFSLMQEPFGLKAWGGILYTSQYHFGCTHLEKMNFMLSGSTLLDKIWCSKVHFRIFL